jgi:hypothetical protein
VKSLRNLLCLVFIGCVCSPLLATTWYVRPDGGTRYSAKEGKGQCDGKSDTAYSGRGSNQHCAFKEYRFLYDDQSYGSHAWVIAGGDTVILHGGPYRVGYDTNSGRSLTWCYGGDGTYACYNPTIPAGTAAQHTRILGENYAACGSKSKMTQLYGGYGSQMTLNLNGAQFVDVQCIELTRHSQCIQGGSPQYPAGCSKNTPLDDYASSGIFTDTKTHDLLLQDMWIHGFPSRGIIGPIGGVVTATRVDIAYNGSSGWDFDDGSSTPLVNAVWNFNDSIIEWSGCNQEYPIAHPNPAISCYGQSNTGYGDGVGSPAGTGLTANIDHSIFRYNIQDGLDLGHVDKGNHTLSITNSTFIGNGGGQFKWGPNMLKAVITNNMVVANCMRMSAPMTGTPTTYNANLGDFCRAGDAISFNFRQGGTVLFANNTIVTYAPSTLDIQCWDAPGLDKPFSANTGCANATLTFKNNIVLGYDNPGTYPLGGKSGGPSGFYYEGTIGHVERSNNLYYGIRGMRYQTVFSGDKYDDPKFVSQPHFSKEQDLDNFDFHLSPSSPARGAGARIPEVKTDIDGKPRPTNGNYDLGAYQN